MQIQIPEVNEKTFTKRLAGQLTKTQTNRRTRPARPNATYSKNTSTSSWSRCAITANRS